MKSKFIKLQNEPLPKATDQELQCLFNMSRFLHRLELVKSNLLIVSFLSLFENMQLTNHFHLNFTFLNLYLKDTLLRPTCRASTLWRDLIRMFKRSLEKSEKPHHMQKQRETGGVPMEQRESHPTIRNPDRPATPQRHPSGTPRQNPNGTHQNFH